MDEILSIKDLNFSFGKNKVLNGVNLNIKIGEIYGIVGNNGVGKTTLLKLICGLLKPTGGEINFNNNELFRIGVLIESSGVYGGFNAYENLRAKSILLGLRKTEGQIKELLSFVGLGNACDKKVRKFSMGMKQRLGIALALIGDPQLLVLDEPINGLDPEGISEINNIIRRIVVERECTVLVSSHILEELLKVATNFAFIKGGKVIKDIPKKQLLLEKGDLPIEEYYLQVIRNNKARL